MKARQEPSPPVGGRARSRGGRTGGGSRPAGTASGTSAANFLSASPGLAGTPRPRRRGWEEEVQAVGRPYLAGAGLPRGTGGAPLSPGAPRCPRGRGGRALTPPAPPRSQPRRVPGPPAAVVPPPTLESLKRLFFPESGARGKGKGQEGAGRRDRREGRGEAGRAGAGRGAGSNWKGTGPSPAREAAGEPAALGRAHRPRPRPEQPPLAMGTEPRVSAAAPAGRAGGSSGGRIYPCHMWDGRLGGGLAAWAGVREERVKAAGLGGEGDAEPVGAAGMGSWSCSLAGRPTNSEFVL